MDHKKVSKATFLSSGSNNEGEVVLETLIRWKSNGMKTSSGNRFKLLSKEK